MKRLLIVGSSGNIGQKLLKILSPLGWIIGAHCFNGEISLKNFLKNELTNTISTIDVFQANLINQKCSHGLVDNYVKWAGGIDLFVQLTGDVSGNEYWMNIDESSWLSDLAVNLNAPFFLTQRVFSYMKQNPDGGRIILMSTASVATGGSSTSMGYGVAKSGVQCIVKGIAKEGAKSNILINALAPGFINTDFHTKRSKKTVADIEKRVLGIPVGRAGSAEEIAKIIYFFLEDASGFITGQTLNISGGEWL